MNWPDWFLYAAFFRSEPYFTLSRITLSGNNQFYLDDIQMNPYNVEHKWKAKYEQSILV